MIKVKTLQCNPLQENCYVVIDDATGEAAVIDCGAFYAEERQAVVEQVCGNGLTLRHVLCTHAHFDHIFGLDTLYAKFNVRPRLHSADDSLYIGMGRQVTAFFGTGYDRDLPPLGPSLTDGEQIALGSHRLQVLHTPGHSPGSVLFHIPDEQLLFSGDTLFRMGVGRTDLEGGSWTQLMQSLHQVVAQLPPDTTVLPGHGPATTIGGELRTNPYLKN